MGTLKNDSVPGALEIWELELLMGILETWEI